jgi:hypothetical protein
VFVQNELENYNSSRIPIIKRRFSTKKFTINIIHDKTTTQYKVSLVLKIKRQQTFFAIMSFYAFLTTNTTQPSVTNFLCKDPPGTTNENQRIDF